MKKKRNLKGFVVKKKKGEVKGVPYKAGKKG